MLQLLLCKLNTFFEIFHLFFNLLFLFFWAALFWIFEIIYVLFGIAFHLFEDVFFVTFLNIITEIDFGFSVTGDMINIKWVSIIDICPWAFIELKVSYLCI